MNENIHQSAGIASKGPIKAYRDGGGGIGGHGITNNRNTQSIHGTQKMVPVGNTTGCFGGASQECFEKDA